MAPRHGNSLLFAWLVEGWPAQCPAGPWLHLSFLKPELSVKLDSSANLCTERALTISFNTLDTVGKFKKNELNAHHLSADRIVNGRLLLLLQFPSASFFPIITLAWLFSSSGGTLGLPVTPDCSVGFLLSLEASVTCGAAWKNFCRAACVFWAEAVQDCEAGGGVTGFRTLLRGADSTEGGRGDAWFWLPSFGGCTADLVRPFLIRAFEEEVLKLLWWELQIKVSGVFPGL